MLVGNLSTPSSFGSIQIHSYPSNTHVRAHARARAQCEQTARIHSFMSSLNKRLPGSMKGQAVV